MTKDLDAPPVHFGFSRDGRYFASQVRFGKSSRRDVRVWETATGRELAVLRGHGDPVTTVALTPDGRHIISRDARGQTLEWALDSVGPCKPRVVAPVPPFEPVWPDGHIENCEGGAYAVVVLGNEVIPCKIERQN